MNLYISIQFNLYSKLLTDFTSPTTPLRHHFPPNRHPHQCQHTQEQVTSLRKISNTSGKAPRMEILVGNYLIPDSSSSDCIPFDITF